MSEKKSKDIKVSIISYQQYTEYDYIDVANYFIVSAMQEYVYFHTNERSKAQLKCNEMFGEGKYTVKASKISKTKSKLEGGGYSAIGIGTTKGQKR